jgi:sugar lactone lactonase YvrE
MSRSDGAVRRLRSGSRLGWIAALALAASPGCKEAKDRNVGNVVHGPEDAPRVAEAVWVDEDQNGVDPGDLLLIRFTREVFVHGSDVAAIGPESSAETLGDDALLCQSVPGTDRVEIRLGDDPILAPGAAGQSGATRINVNADGQTAPVESKQGFIASPRGRGIVLADATAVAPRLVQAQLFDRDRDGAIGAGDVISAGFDKPIRVPAGAAVADHFSLPVAGDSFGAGASLAAASSLSTNRAVAIILGAGASVTADGQFRTAALAAGSPTGVTSLQAAVDPITDTVEAAPNPVLDGATVDLEAGDGGFFGNGREGDALFGNLDAFTPGLTASGVRDPAGQDRFAGTLTVQGEDFDVSLLFLADRGNDRVLIYRSYPQGSFPAASWVLGQSDFTTRSSADPSDPTDPEATAASLHRPSGIAFDAGGNRLYVADTGNHRIVVWDDLFAVDPSSGELTMENGRAASFVLGQSDFGDSDPNRGAPLPGASTLNAPSGLAIGGGRLAVADSGNSRVIIFGTLPDGASALPSTVLGQGDFSSGAPNRGGTTDQDTLDHPEDVFIDDAISINGSSGAVVVADTGNHRVLIFESAAPATGADADVVLGQASFIASAAGAAAASMSSPSGARAAPSGSSPAFLAVADRGNHRVLLYDVAAALASGAAGEVLAQDAAPAASANRGGDPTANSLSGPERVLAYRDAADDERLLVADAGNHRLLDFPIAALPAGDPDATLVVGQPGFTSGTAGGHALDQPTDALVVGGRLIVSDTGNHRVIIYDGVPSAGEPAPSAVLGQPDLHSSAPNRGGSAAADTLLRPTGLASDGTRLAVADTGNHRILIWSAIPLANGAPADVVIGQPDFASALPNAGGPVSAQGLQSPEGLDIDGKGRLAVADRDNHRVLLFADFAALTDFSAAALFLGQEKFSDNEANRDGDPGAGTLFAPRDVLSGGRGHNRFFVADSGNHRVLVWEKLPNSKGEPADGVLGQVDLSTTAAAGGRSDTLLSPSSLAMDREGTFLAVSDTGHHRILLFRRYDGAPGSPDQARLVLGQSGFFGDRANRGAGAPGLSTLSGPRGIFFNGFELHVTDTGNTRVVSYR